MSHNQPSAQAFAAIIIDSRGTTALHQAAGKGTVKDLSGVTAELLATVKDKRGAAQEGGFVLPSDVLASLL